MINNENINVTTELGVLYTDSDEDHKENEDKNGKSK